MSEQIDRLRRLYPTVSDSFFDLLEERQELSQELGKLRSQIAHLIGRYAYHAEHDCSTELAALVGGLRVAIAERGKFGGR